jgi:hypothetical protein
MPATVRSPKQTDGRRKIRCVHAYEAPGRERAIGISRRVLEVGPRPRKAVTRPHLPADTQVPAGFGTSRRHMPAAGCPGIKGPVPPPVSMDAVSVGMPPPSVNRFIAIKRYL